MNEDGATPNDVPRGILAICAGLAFLTLNDAIAKLLTERHDPVQILFLRNLIAVPMIAAAALVLHGPRALTTRRPGLHAVRGLTMLAGVWFYFAALGLLPLAQATALIFAAPIIITALSVPLLGERVGPWRWGAVVLGFCGVLIVVQPGGAAFQAASLLPVAAALAYALFMISGRWLGPEDGFLTTMLFVMLFPMLYAAPFALWLWSPPRLEDLGLFVGSAVCGSLGITLIGQAFRIAPAAVVAPFEYTALIWATALGWAIWGDVPGGATVAGALVIVAGGVLIAWREARRRD